MGSIVTTLSLFAILLGFIAIGLCIFVALTAASLPISSICFVLLIINTYAVSSVIKATFFS